MVDQPRINALFDALCKKAKSRITQSNDSILWDSRRRLIKDPSDLDAMHVVACHALVKRSPGECLEVLQDRVAYLAHDSVANQIAGYASMMDGDLEAATIRFENSVRLDPHHVDCWLMLGRINERQNAPDKAIQFYKRAVVFERRTHEAAITLARSLAKRGNLKDAIHTIRVCLICDKRSPELNLVLANLLNRRAIMLKRHGRSRERMRLLHETLNCFQIVNSVAPTANSYIMQGLLQQRLGLFEAARDSFQKALERDPESLDAKVNLASANVDCGQISPALEQYEEVLAAAPDRASAHFRYTRAKRFVATSDTMDYLTNLRGELSKENLDVRQRVHLHFALAKVLDDLGNYEHAWEHYDAANRLKPEHSKSNHERTPFRTRKRVSAVDVVDLSIDFFDEAFFARSRQRGHQSETPVFIVGMPRSGTTLTEQILSSHPDIAGAGELKLIDQIRHEILQGVGSYPTSLDVVPCDRVDTFARYYLVELDKHRTDECRVTDKMPTNFLHLGLIATLFPNATIIHCRRNPMDVFVSSYCQNLNAPFCDLDQLLEYYEQYQRIMQHWHRVLPMPIHTVDYESLVADAQSQSRLLIEHCGLRWNEKCLDFHKNDRAVHTPSKWQVRQPLYSTSVEKWRRFESQLQPIAERLGCE